VLKFSVDSQNIQVSISDQGEGIPKEYLPYIFDPFYRGDSARNRAAGGSGIGLSLAKALVNLHDGKIDVRTEASRGSTFIVTIPNRSNNPVPSEKKSLDVNPTIQPTKPALV
jgi:signal transduction histidine kinase